MTKQNGTPEMTNLKILHLSNLLIDATRSDGERIVTDLHKWADAMHDEGHNYEKDIDYLVLCGNITRDGENASFETAARVLRNLADFLLKPDKEDTNLTRLLVVPGVKDIPLTDKARPDPSGFQRFYNELLFGDEISREKIEEFDPDTVIVRHFKDLTLVGACYWTDQRGITSRREMLLRFGEAIRKIKEYQEVPRENWVSYVRLTPTLLATAETPLLSPGVYAGMDSQIDELRRILERQIETTLHLFGEGATPLLAPQPFAFNYLSLGTGPRGRDKFWPLQMNLIEINYDACLPEMPRRQSVRCPSLDVCGQMAPEAAVPLLRHTAYRLNGNNQSWKHASYEDGLLDKFCKLGTQDRSSASVFEETLKQVRKGLQDGWPIVAVRGITGSGKWDLYSELGEKKFSSGNEHYCVAQLRLNTPEHYEHPEHLLSKLHEKFKECATHKDHKGLAIIYDDVYSTRANTDKEKIIDVIEKLLENTNDYTGGVIYFVTETDFIQAYDPPLLNRGPSLPEPVTPPLLNRGPSLPELVNHPSVGWVVLKPLEPRVIDRMISDYSCCAPISPRHIKNVTGQYAGFSKTILENLKEDFEKKDGTTLITRKMIIKMLETALQEDKALRQSRGIVFRILKAADGNKIHGYIQDDLQKRIDRFQSDWVRIIEDLHDNPVILDLDKIRMAYPGEISEIGVRNSLEDLKRFGVFDENLRLMVLGPYLLAVSLGWEILEPPVFQETETERRPSAEYSIAEQERHSHEPFKPADVHLIAELVLATRLAAQDSRRTLCLRIGIGPDEVPFLNDRGDGEFAHDLVEWLNERVAVEPLNQLFDIVEPMLGGYKKETAIRLRKKLPKKNDEIEWMTPKNEDETQDD